MDQKIFRLAGKVQHYDWGGKTFIPEFLGINNAEGRPFAEYWMGAHQNAPALIESPVAGTLKLDAFIATNPAEHLGGGVSKRFVALPYLFKILDVKDMLSIQVHPSREAATRGFAEENARGLSLQSSERNYKDENHKPELMLALSEFWLLHGFKEPAAMERILQSVPELAVFLPAWKQNGYEAVYRQAMEMTQERVNQLLQPLISRILPLYDSNKLDRISEDFWAARAFHNFCKTGDIDRGLFSIYFFNLVNLHPGEVIFQDAGLLHAYLEGQNLELMANSDNVLRGGLTSKKVDVSELMKHVRFEPTSPRIIRPVQASSDGEAVYPTPATDFELRKMQLAPGQSMVLTCSTADIFLIWSGTANASAGETRLELVKGQCLIGLPGAEIQFRSGSLGALVYHATVPDVE